MSLLRPLLPIILWMVAVSSAQASRDTFDMLEVDSEVYSNVVVTSRTTTHVFITHSFGIIGLRVSSLDPAVLKQLGYGTERPERPPRAFSFPNEVLIPARAREVKRDLQAIVRKENQEGFPAFLILLVLFWVVLHLFVSYCFKRICLKAGTAPGLAVWIPAVQIFPLLRAAGMSPWWWLVWFVPGANLVVVVIWSIKLCAAVRKSKWAAFWLLLPLTSFFALVYLAFAADETSDDPAQPATPFVYQR